MSFGKPVNSRTLADVNRANASFHGTQDEKKDERIRESAELAEDAVNPEARNSTASGKSHKGQRILGNKQFNMRAAQANKNESMFKNGKKTKGESAANAYVKPSKDISHENGKQVIKQKGQVVSQHDEGDSSPDQRNMRKEMNPSKLRGLAAAERETAVKNIKKSRASSIFGPRIGGRTEKEVMKHQLKASDADAFPATDKTIADVNAANARFHSGDSEDAEYKSNFGSPGERPPYLEEVKEKTVSLSSGKPGKVAYGKEPAHITKIREEAEKKSSKDFEGAEGEYFQDPKQNKANAKSAVKALHHMEMVHTPKKGEEIRQAGSYEKGDFNPKKYAPKASAFHGDAFPATDKTLADVNDANLAYYNNSPHAGNAQDAEKKSEKVEAHGVKGMNSTPWRKTFPSTEHMNKWVEKNSAEVHATRKAEDAKEEPLKIGNPPGRVDRGGGMPTKYSGRRPKPDYEGPVGKPAPGDPKPHENPGR